MNNKLISMLMAGAMVGAVGTSAYASGVTATPVQANKSTTTQSSSATPVSKVPIAQNTSTSKTSTNTTSTSKETANVSTVKNNVGTQGKDIHHSNKNDAHHRDDMGQGWIKSQLEAGKTVSQIKAELVSNFNAKTNNLVTSKKITQDQANKREQAFAKHMEKHDVLKGIIANAQVKKDLETGKTLAQAESSLISSKDAVIQKNLSAKKITQDQATKREANVKKAISKGHGVFVNEGMVHKIREQINDGKTLAQAKQAIVQDANTHLESLVKSGKIKSENLSKVETHVDKKIENNAAFENVSNVGWIQKALEDGQTATQIKATFDAKLNQKEAKVEANKNLSQTQISKIKSHISNLQLKQARIPLPLSL